MRIGRLYSTLVLGSKNGRDTEGDAMEPVNRRPLYRSMN